MELQNGYRTIFLVKGSIGQVWNPYRTQRNPFLRVCIEPFRGSKYVALLEPFKVLYRTFSSKSAIA